MTPPTLVYVQAAVLFALLFVYTDAGCREFNSGESCFSSRQSMAREMISMIKPGSSNITTDEFKAAWMIYSEPEIRFNFGDQGMDIVTTCVSSGSNVMTLSSISQRCSCIGYGQIAQPICDMLSNIRTSNAMP